jgi:hypothetical protein
MQEALLRKQTAVDQILASYTTMARIFSEHGMDAHIDSRMYQQLQLCLDQLGGVSHCHTTLQQHAVDYMRTVYNPNSMLWVRIAGVYWVSLAAA